jgi:hypothetical protein
LCRYEQGGSATALTTTVPALSGKVVIEEGNHSLNNEPHLTDVAVQHMLSFVRSL